jgi:acyl-[acyl-carrier-protein]-phospholipid O-acyltransferase/long-chain-fatty-acid--[acyl-carrier-protein] ligase
MAVFAIGIGFGSALGAILSHGRLLLLAIPLSGVGLGLALLDLARVALTASPESGPSLGEQIASWQGVNAGLDLAIIAILGGLYVVPAFSALQAWSPASHRARMVAATNIVSAGMMAASSLAIAGAAILGCGPGTMLLVTGLTTLAVAIALGRWLPINVMSDVLSVVFRTLFRMEVEGRDNLGLRTGPVIIALNHVSFLDAALAVAILDATPVFAIDAGIAQRWWVRPFLGLVNAMPLDPTKPMATRSLINAVRRGDDLVIFPEGRLTVTGSLMKVYDGAGLVADKTGAQIIPVRIDGLERSVFSRLKHGQVRTRLFPKVRVTILEPVRLRIDDGVKGKTRRIAAGAALYEIMSDLIFRTSVTDHTLFTAVAEAARVHGPRRVALQDPIAGTMTYARLLAGARILGQKLAACAPVDARVGLLLPNANATAAALIGLVSARRVPAMLNVTAGEANLLAACRAAEIRVIVTARSFVEKARLGDLVDRLAQDHRIVYLEDVRAQVRWTDKLAALRRRYEPILPSHADAAAVVLFTSGSEGTPKGVVLSHRNMLTNAAQAQARIDFGRQDRVFNVLPTFHAFGLTVGLVLPLVSGVPVYLYPSPLHYRIVPELVYASNSTILFGTDTFLSGYARSAHPYDFRSLRYVIAGAEPVKAATRQTYMTKFGLRILEGYGVTEAGPVIALNTPMFTRDGSVGRVMPGLATRIDPVPGITRGGRLSVRGPNVMLGYLRAENPAVLEPPPEGWHDTGDIVILDDQGYVTIQGRAKRFAKIGGEMVSLAMLEACASALWPTAANAAAALPDARKGERIVLLTTEARADRSRFAAFARTSGISDLAIPAEIRVVPTIPMLGSGKVDFAAVGRMVRPPAGANAA